MKTNMAPNVSLQVSENGLPSLQIRDDVLLLGKCLGEDLSSSKFSLSTTSCCKIFVAKFNLPVS